MPKYGKNLTAFVLAGGGSLGAVQVGMLAALARRGVVPDLVVGASVGAINAAYYAAEPDERGVERLKRIWRGLRRTDVFPFSPIVSMLGFFGKTDHLVSPTPLRSLIESELPYRRLEDVRLPCHVVATDALEGAEVVLSSGPAATALLASAAIPGVFPPVLLDGRFLLDGGVSNNTPISIAVELGATRVIVLPTGISCALQAPPRAAYRHYWFDQLRSNLVLSTAGENNPASAPASTNKSTRSAHVNLIWSPVANSDLGLEYIHADRETEDGLKGHLNRLQASAKYAF